MKLKIRTLLARHLRKGTRSLRYRVKRGLARGLRREGGLGFVPEWLVPIGAEEFYLRSLAWEGKTIYDVGGFEGVFALFFARATGPGGRVIVYEPNPANVQCIQRNLALNDFIHARVEPLALGNRNGQAQLQFDDHNTGRGSIGGVSAEPSSLATLTIQMIRFDDWFNTAKEPPPDFIKIDVEGYELSVLEGMAHTLDKNRPELWIETHAMYIAGEAEQKRYRHSLTRFVEERGYHINHIEEGRALTSSDTTWPDGHLHCTPHTDETRDKRQ